MVELDPIVSWPIAISILLILLIAGLLPLNFYWKKGVSSSRLLAKGLLFLGFWLSLSWIVLAPNRLKEAGDDAILVYSGSVDRDQLNFWKDSLAIQKTRRLDQYQKGTEKVYLLGDDFELDHLYQFKDLDFEWLIPQNKTQIKSIHWKGAIRKGETQRLNYSIYSPQEESNLQVGSISDTVLLQKGWNSGAVEFLPAGVGKISLPLILDLDTLTQIRFFTQAPQPKKYHFQVGFPGAEIRTLSNWLRGKGETVTEQIQLSRQTFLQSGPDSDSLEIQLVDPSQLSKKAIQDWVKDGKGSLVVLNVSDPASVASQVNRLFGTGFQVEKISSEISRQLSSGIEALPFQWKEMSGQELIQEGAIAIQEIGGVKVAISFIQESFPLMLEGNEAEYEQIWSELLGKLEPDESNSIQLEAPVLLGVNQGIRLMDQDSLPNYWLGGEDTIYLRKSAINPFLAEGEFQTSESGWVKGDRDFAFYSYEPSELPLMHVANRVHQIQASNPNQVGSSQQIKKPLSPWIGLIGMLLFLGGMWLEPKLN
ncbi:hypothetical protein [Algoriphagus zhangzhouensis]|uniref:N-terminal double-transmembrane domain-containing protein n=1 Tax=Algoriphagus zhangzhouensis TaxID=1073327 RepID=A0A1M7Z7H3_9BACT|nr:hypothetical protein [Algoriphagus zhangzhouensis]TDY49247.1 hypothetical protein A8938_0939 [Algoriphagus zhangzhouensis]SHO60656.1 hypothetical protein SAMN04488108_0939 [Algoriphagus zhangzhouensis]